MKTALLLSAFLSSFATAFCGNTVYADLPIGSTMNFTVKGSIHPNEVVYIGTCGTKSYFADPSTNINWADARQYCQSMSLYLPTIVSKAEADCLDGLRSSNFEMSQWLDASDSLTLRQMSWQRLTGEPDDSFLNLCCVFGTEQHTCLSYLPGGNRKVGLDRCSNTKKAVFCETG